MNNLNSKQIISIIGAIVSALMVATSQLTDLFGAGVAKEVVSAAALANMVLQSVMVSLTGNMPQADQVRQVLAMPGVEKLDVNAKASPELAKLAVDPNIDKIAPIPAAISQVTQTAKAAI